MADVKKKDVRCGDRINLRFSNRNLIDDMRLAAEREGLHLPQWAMATLIKEVREPEESKTFFYEHYKISLVSLKLIEKGHSQRDIQAAYDEVDALLGKDPHAR